jgi:hypothetical protein
LSQLYRTRFKFGMQAVPDVRDGGLDASVIWIAIKIRGKI